MNIDIKIRTPGEIVDAIELAGELADKYHCSIGIVECNDTGNKLVMAYDYGDDTWVSIEE